MCGSGTFSLEGAMMANHIPAGWFREFAFMEWPCFKESRWRHFRREAENNMTRVDRPVIFASDTRPRSLYGNWKPRFKIITCPERFPLRRKDFFEMLPSDITDGKNELQKGLVVINPPYGKRMETKAKSQTMFEEICRKLKNDFKGWQFALIAPDKRLADKALFKAARHEIFHGGLKLVLLTGIIK